MSHNNVMLSPNCTVYWSERMDMMGSSTNILVFDFQKLKKLTHNNRV